MQVSSHLTSPIVRYYIQNAKSFCFIQHFLSAWIAGRLLDATKVYMYVFLLAGCEVVLSAIVLCVCNVIFIKKKPEQSDPAKMEMSATDTEMEQLNKVPRGEHEDGGGKEEAETENVQEIEQINEEVREKPEVEPQKSSPKEQEASKDEQNVTVDSVELEKVSKEVTKVNGVAVEPESSL